MSAFVALAVGMMIGAFVASIGWVLWLGRETR